MASEFSESLSKAKSDACLAFSRMRDEQLVNDAYLYIQNYETMKNTDYNVIFWYALVPELIFRKLIQTKNNNRWNSAINEILSVLDIKNEKVIVQFKYPIGSTMQ